MGSSPALGTTTAVSAAKLDPTAGTASQQKQPRNRGRTALVVRSENAV